VCAKLSEGERDERDELKRVESRVSSVECRVNGMYNVSLSLIFVSVTSQDSNGSKGARMHCTMINGEGWTVSTGLVVRMGTV
jgi:hypothetical protein